jgi:Tfp pilus assembly protein PilN
MHINLIFEEEQRSASPVSLRLIIRLAALVVLVLAGVWAFSFYAGYHALQNKQRSVEEEWKKTEPKYKAAVQMRDDLVDRTATLKEIKGWSDSRIAWGTQLRSLQPAVPSVIQLTELRVSQTILSLANNLPARAFEMKISGRTGAARSEVNVVQFMEALKQPPFTGVIKSAELPPGAFRQDPASKTDRVFEIICKYVPRALE